MALKFERMWQTAADEFLKQTGKSIRKNPPTTLQDCFAVIERSQQLSVSRESEEESKVEKAKTWGLSVINCLKIFGGIASQAADMTFPASSMCFNAISFLLDIPQEIHDFHIAVNGLFEAIGPTLSQFKIYDQMEQFDDLDSGLLLAIQQMMICFVDICKLSIVLRESSTFRMKLKFKSKLILLKDDSGVQTQLNRLKSLSDTHSQVQGTQILKLALDSNSRLKTFLDGADHTEQVVLETHANVTSLKDSDEKRKREESSKNRLKGIQEKLGINDAVRQSSAKLCDKLWKASVSGTGDWILHRPEFSKWTDSLDSDGSRVFFLSGGPNTGKSILAATILHQLQEKYQSGGGRSSRILIGSYFFSTDKSGTGKDDEDGKPVHTAIKTIAYQLAEQDTAFEGTLSRACESKDVNDRLLKDATCMKLWELLGIGTPKGKATHYLFFDGLADLGVDAREAVGQLIGIVGKLDQTKSPVRVFISVRPDILELPLPFQPSEVCVEQYNQGDLRGYIDDALKKMDLLQESDEDSTRIKGKVLEKLSTQVMGNYYKVNTALESLRNIINNDGTEQQVESILETSREDQNAMLQAQIDELQLMLSPQDICELNELLTWTMFIRNINVSVEILKAALFLRFRKHSIQPLEKKLKTKYSKVFKVSDGGLVEVVDGVKDLLIKPRIEPRSMDETPRFSATITITKGDRTSVQSFLWKLVQEFNTYDFVHEDDASQKAAKENIQVNEFDAHLIIVRRMLQLISEDPNSKTQALGPYSLCFLPDHLSNLRNLEMSNGPDKLKSSEKREIGDGLYKLFVNTDDIKKHWDNCEWVLWYGNEGEISTFLNWLSDESVTGHLGLRDRKWLKEVARHDKPARLLLTDIMKMMAERWLQDSSWEAPAVFEWLNSHLRMVGVGDDDNSPSRAGDSTKDDTASTQGTSSPEVTVATVENWCRREFFRDTVPDSLWYQRLGDTYYSENDRDMAINSYRKAIELNSQSTSCYERLASYLANDPRDSESIRRAVIEMDKASELAEKDESYNEEKLIDIYLQLVEWYYQLQQQRPAKEYMNKILNLNPSQVDIQCKLLRSCLINSDQEIYVKLWCQLTKGPDNQFIHGSLNNIFQNLMLDGYDDSDLIMKWLFFISAENDNCQFFLDEIGFAIDSTQQEEQYLKGSLLVYEGIARYYFQETSMLIGTDVDSWSRCLEECTGSTRYYPKAQASRFISAHHFDRARAETNPSSKDKHVQSLKMLVSKDPPFTPTAAKSYLASFYATSNDHGKAKEVLRGSMSSGLDMLSDSETDNDWEGYYCLATILANCGDHLNALSAFSHLLYTPPGSDVLGWLLDFDSQPARDISRNLQASIKQELPTLSEKRAAALIYVKDLLHTESEEKGTNNIQALQEIQIRLHQLRDNELRFNFFLNCDGRCGRQWDFDNSLYMCKYCYDTGFCEECLAKLKRGENIFSFGGLVCSDTHDWVYLPKREKREWLKCLMGNVMVGGHIENGVRVDGESVPVSQWLGSLKREWGWVVETSDLEVDEKKDDTA
ncbi:hypothetical protein F4781DRAFT_430670 [Annulohypoxylon bovei var. microspora]|nr:hypothetical protein F4781DRAFT_430670 [Annulohypoxylon bovei var. microspora]